MKGIAPPAISATLLSDEQIEITLKGIKKDNNFTASTRDFILTDAKGNIIHPSYQKIVPNMGMKREGQVGQLIISFEIQFPTLTEETINSLEKLL
jgi:hypothetical protein